MAAFYHNKQYHPHRPAPPQENPLRWVTLVALVALVARAKSPYYTGPLSHRRGRGLRSLGPAVPIRYARAVLYTSSPQDLILEDLILEDLILEDLILEDLVPNCAIAY